MVELGLRGRVDLEKTGMRRKSLLNRKVIFLNDQATGDTILDEAQKLIKDTDPPETIPTWVELLSGLLTFTSFIFFYFAFISFDLILHFPNILAVIPISFILS